jgi:hypothetical protein
MSENSVTLTVVQPLPDRGKMTRSQVESTSMLGGQSTTEFLALRLTKFKNCRTTAEESPRRDARCTIALG